MALRPEVFISAAAPELNAYRKLVRHALEDMGAQPVEHTDFEIEYGPLHGVLSQKIGRCAAVIHLAGFQYGEEPSERTLHAPRRSFSHYEVDVAQKVGAPVYFFVAAPESPRLPFGDEDAEARTLQQEHRTAITQCGVHYETFSSPDELGRKLRGLRSKLIVRRRLARLPSRMRDGEFVGRFRLFAELREELAPGGVHVLQPSPAFSASGGAGASAAALELAWRLYEEEAFDFVFWLPAGPRTEFEASLAALARSESLSLLSHEVVSHRARLAAVTAWFQLPENAGRFLVIIDGVDHDAAWWAVKSALPGFQNGSVLLTGRLTLWPEMRIHTVAPLLPEDAGALFLHRLQSGATVALADRIPIERLIDLLGRIPLALAIAAGHLREARISPRDFLLDWSSRHRGAESLAEISLPEICGEAIRALDASAESLLRLLVCLAPEPAPIPLGLFDQRADWTVNRASLAFLERRGLISFDDPNRAIRMHRAVREIARDWLMTGKIGDALGTARVLLEAALQRAAESVDPAQSGLRELLIPHCCALLGQLKGHPQELHASPLVKGVADWLNACGRAGEAEPFFRRALSIDERRLARNHRDLAPRIRDLAGALQSLRRLDEAEALYRRALAIDQHYHGAESSEVAADLGRLGACLREAGRLEEAESVFRREAAIEEMLGGAYHAKVANALHRLAGVLEAGRRLRDAKALYRRALEIEEISFGAEHPRVAVRIHHLARVLAATGNREESEELFRRGLRLDERRLGQNHPELIPALGEFADLLAEIGRTEEALRVYGRAEALCREHFGDEHLETALLQASLAALLHDEDRYEEAIVLHEAAATSLAKEARRMRGDHPHLKSLLANYATALRAVGCEEEEIVARTASYLTFTPRRESSRFEEEGDDLGRKN